MAETIVAWRDRPNLCRVVAKWVHEGFWFYPAKASKRRRPVYAGAMINLAAADFRAPRWRASPAGMGSIVEHDLESRPQWTPWLAAVAVNRAARGRGNSSTLVRFIGILRPRMASTHTFGCSPGRRKEFTRISPAEAIDATRRSHIAQARWRCPSRCTARAHNRCSTARPTKPRENSVLDSFLTSRFFGGRSIRAWTRRVTLFPTARCQIIPGSWVSNARDNLSDRFGHQLWFVLMDVVAALSGDEEARVRDKLRQIFVGRVQY